MRRSTASLTANILTAHEQACFASSAAQKRSINGHFAVIFEKPRVALQAQNFCFKSPIHCARCGTAARARVPVWSQGGTRIGRLLASASRCYKFATAAKRSFRMGVASWRLAQNHRGRAAVLAVLEELPVICSVMVAVGSMVMLGIMLCRDWPQ
jgi:hypothetical protein